MFSHREDVTILNPMGSLDHEWEQVNATMEHVSSQMSDGEITSFEILEKHVTPELAYAVWVERSKARVGGRHDIGPFDLRVTLILRPEDGTWKVVHRHADSVTTDQPIEAVLKE
jgi:ketosteroid isomerase-like protein